MVCNLRSRGEEMSGSEKGGRKHVRQQSTKLRGHSTDRMCFGKWYVSKRKKSKESKLVGFTYRVPLIEW